MMESHRDSVEFEAVIDRTGKITIPDHIAREFGKHAGRVHVRLTTRSLNERLTARGVHEEEIKRIGAMQLESREQVVKFLLSEGTLRNSKLVGPGKRR